MTDKARGHGGTEARRGRVSGLRFPTCLWSPLVPSLGAYLPACLRGSRDQLTLELVGVRGLGDGVFLGDHAVEVELGDRAVEAAHADGAVGLDDVGDLEGAGLADQVADGGGAEERLDGGAHAGL